MDRWQTLSGHDGFETKSLTPISRSYLFTELFGLDPISVCLSVWGCLSCHRSSRWIGLPYANKEMMAHHLTQISLAVPKGRHAVLVVDQATFHKTDKLICPDNISLLFLPPYAPELNPVENLWAQLRHGWLANRCFEGYDAIVEACCEAWNAYTTRHNAIKKLCSRKWATIQS